MPTEYYYNIRRRFFASVAIILLVLAGLFCWNSVRDYQLVISSAEKRSASYVSALKEHAERVFAEADNSLKDLIDEIEENGGLKFTQNPQFYKLLSDRAKNGPHFSSIYVVDSNADIIAHSLEYRIKPVNLSDRDYFLHHRDNPASGLFISKPFKSRVSNTWRFSLSRPLRDVNGHFIGLISVTFESGYFEKFYKNIDVGGKGRIILSTSTGDILVSEPFSEKVLSVDFKNAQLFKKYLPASQTGTYHVDKAVISQTPSIISYSKLSSFPVVSVIVFDKGEVLLPCLAHIYNQVFLGVLLVILIAVLSSLFLRQVRKLERANLLLEAQQDDLELKAELIDSASDAILLLDESGRLIQFNNALCGISGRSRQELETMRIQDIEPPEYADKVVENIQRLFEIDNAVFESAYIHTTGTVIPVEVHARPFMIGQRRLVLSVVRDIRERKAADNKVMATIKEWQGTFDAVEDAVWLLDTNRRIVRANKATRKVFGKSPQEVIGLDCCKAAHTDQKPHQACPFERMIESKKRASIQMDFANRWFEVSVDPVFAEDGAIISGVHIVKDITDLKKAELRERIRSEILERIARGESLSRLLDFIAVSIEKESPGALCSILLVDEDGQRLLNGAAPNLPDFYNIAVNRTKIGEGIGSCGTAAFRRERVVAEDIESHPFWKGFAPAREAGLRSCWSEPIFSSSGALLGTFAIYHRTPATPGTEEIRLIEQAAIFAGLAVERSRDETQRDELEQQLSQSQKMEAVGHLSGGIAHDFNNLLTPIIIYADMLKRSLPADEKMHHKIDGIIKASHKARDLTQQLLSFGRKQVMQMQIVDLNDIVSSFHSIIRRTLRESIDINLQFSPQSLFIRADRSKLDQVILNLAINAQDAIDETGQITIETGQVMIDDEYARLHPGLNPGDYALLAFQDDGCGMSDETLRHIFEPFFTTKQVGHGTGLGLSNVYGVVKQHNGFIAAHSKLGGGTTFKVYFPLTDQKSDGSAQVPEGGNANHSGVETILLVEDNEMVRTMTRDLLEGLGYTVHAADHPDMALEIVGRRELKIDLVITDVVMPGMNGKQLFERITTDRPEIDKVLYMSGYTNNVIVTDGALEEGLHFLQKPFTVDLLMDKVRTILHSRG